MAILVQGVQSGFARVADSVGMNYKLRKEGVALVKKLPDACVIASIGTVGKIRGGIAISFDREGLSACVSAMSGGMLAGDPDDPMSVSCIGELVNMTGGGLRCSPPKRVLRWMSRLRRFLAGRTSLSRGRLRCIGCPFRTLSGIRGTCF